MRSHPYTPASPLPPVLQDLATILPIPNKAVYRSKDDSDIPLSLLDHDTSRLIPLRKRKRHVWVQGKLAQVRSVSKPPAALARRSRASDTDLHRATSQDESPSAAAMAGTAVGSQTLRGRASHVDLGIAASARRGRSVDEGCLSEEEEDAREIATRDSQLRGYGIGGAGNIRRATDVIHGPSRLGGPMDGDQLLLTLREFIAKRSERKGKTRAYAS